MLRACARRLAFSPRQVRFLSIMSARGEQALDVISRDFRSDTFTGPTGAMFEYMRASTRGDDVYGEDATTNAFQERIAKLAGKEAGLYAVSGTMTNQLALRTHLTQPPHSVLCDARAHIHVYEAGGIAYHSQASTQAVMPRNGHHLTLEDVKAYVKLPSDDIMAVHYAPTRIVALENTRSGLVFPQDEVIRISKWAHENGLIMHCDGARMFDASARTGLSLAELCAPFDSVSLCLSKGIGAPIGSILVGSKLFIAKARHFRKLFGAGIRQSGMLCAAAEYALDHHLPQFPKVHELARRLGQGLHDAGLEIVYPVETNMVFVRSTPSSVDFDDIVAKARELDNPITLGGPRRQGAGTEFRLVLHHQTSQAAVDELIDLVRRMQAQHGAEMANDDARRQSAALARGENFNLAPDPAKAPVRPGDAYGR